MNLRREGSCFVVMLLASSGVASAQGSKPPAAGDEAAGPRLKVQFVETRIRADKTTATRPCVLLLHAGEKSARVFVGTQLRLTTSDKRSPSVVFKNAGTEAQVGVEALSDGRYRLNARYEQYSAPNIEPAAPRASDASEDNPVLRVLRGESKLVVSERQTVPFATAVDATTGEVVRVDVTLTADHEVKVAAAPSTADGAQVRVQFILSRRQGDRKIASRPYAVVLQADQETTGTIFSGSQLPVETTPTPGTPTIVLQDVGAGARVTVHRLPDGRYRLDIRFSDGALSAIKGSPRVQTFQADSRLYVRLGETVPLASAVDSQSGDVVEVDVTLERTK